MSGATIDNGTLVFSGGVISAVGTNVSVPAGAITVAGKGLTVYPGLIDMGSSAGFDAPAIPRAENPQTTEDIERVKRDTLLRAHLRAADHINPRGAVEIGRSRHHRDSGHARQRRHPRPERAGIDLDRE